jgi:hypothetical protein
MFNGRGIDLWWLRDELQVNVQVEENTAGLLEMGLT